MSDSTSEAKKYAKIPTHVKLKASEITGDECPRDVNMKEKSNLKRATAADDSAGSDRSSSASALAFENGTHCAIWIGEEKHLGTTKPAT
eukprot:COSAG06_NODE_43630_length_370_cov_0.793358_1_plen_88_part_01